MTNPQEDASDLEGEYYCATHMGEPENIGSGTYDPSRWKDSVYIDKLVTSQSFIKYLVLKLAVQSSTLQITV